MLKIYSLLSYDALLACIVFSDVLTNMLGKGKDVLFAGDTDHLELPILFVSGCFVCNVYRVGQNRQDQLTNRDEDISGVILM